MAIFLVIFCAMICTLARKVLITNEQTHTCIETNDDEITAYLKDTVFDSYLDFDALSDAQNDTLEMFMDDFITTDNEWVFHRIFDIVKCKPNLVIPYSMKAECKNSMMTLNEKQWQQFSDTCNILGFYGFDSKTTIWKVFEYSRIDIPSELHIIFRHDAVESIHDLPTQYTPWSHQSYTKIFVKEIWMNEYKLSPENMNTLNESEKFMFKVKPIEGQITINYENAVPEDRIMDDDRLKERIHTFQMLGIKDTLYDSDFAVYGWTANLPRGAMAYAFQEQAHIQGVMGVLYAEFYYNTIERYGYDLAQSSMTVGLSPPYGLVADFKFKQ